MWGAPLKFLAGYLPPMHTQDFRLGQETGEFAVNVESCQTPKYAGELHIPHGIQGYFDYEEALACALAQKKPLFIDFTGHGCVNCRKMEEKVWSDPEVLKILKNDYVVVSLYVDDKKIKLSEKEHFKGKFSGNLIKTLGEKNAEIQACYFNSNSQPLYVLMTGNQDLLQHPGSAETFDYNPQKFKEFLQNGLNEFKKIQP
jgi:thiol:disulfide interchange protein DsbD